MKTFTQYQKNLNPISNRIRNTFGKTSSDIEGFKIGIDPNIKTKNIINAYEKEKINVENLKKYKKFNKAMESAAIIQSIRIALATRKVPGHENEIENSKTGQKKLNMTNQDLSIALLKVS